MTGFPDRPPVKLGISIGDSIAALYAVIGALMALRHRDQASGRGQVVDVAVLYEAVFAMMESLVPEYDVAGFVPRLSDTPGGTEWLGPELGAHTAEVLAALGYSAGDITDLRAMGAI